MIIIDQLLMQDFCCNFELGYFYNYNRCAMHIYYNFYAKFWTKFENEKISIYFQVYSAVLVAILFLLDDGPLGVFLFSPVGERALLGVLLLGGTVVLVFGELCLTRVCLNGSVLTVADNPVLVGVVSLEDRLLSQLSLLWWQLCVFYHFDQSL